MPDITANIGLKKPTGNENVTRAAYSENIDILDQNVTPRKNFIFETAGGTATAITLIDVELSDGFPKTFIAAADNNGAATTINTEPLYKPGTTTAPTLKAGKAYTVWYNLAGSCFFLKAGATGTATPAQVLDGVPFSNEDDTDLVGEMPNNSGDHACLSSSVSGTTLKLVAKEGYTDGIDDTVTLTDANFTPENIRGDKIVFGLAGTAAQGPLSRGATGSSRENLLTQVVTLYNVRSSPDGKYFYVLEGTTLRKFDLEFNLVWSITAIWNGGAASVQPGCLAVDQNGDIFAYVSGTHSVTKYSGVDGSIIQYGGVADYINIGGGASTLHCTLAGDKFVCDAYISGSRVLGYNYSTGTSLFSISGDNAEIFGIDKYGYFWTRNYSTANLKCRDINDGSVDYTYTAPSESALISRVSPLGDALIWDEHDSSPNVRVYPIDLASLLSGYTVWSSAWFTSASNYRGFCYDGSPLLLASIGGSSKISIADRYDAAPGMIICVNTSFENSNYVFVGNNGDIYQFHMVTVRRIKPRFKWNS